MDFQDDSAGLRIKDCYKLLFNEDLIGVIVYSGSYLNLRPRNMVFGDRYKYTPGDLYKARLINEEIARISRVVIHPKFRGIGLGAFLVKETLSKVNVKLVEVLAAMAKYNPFFEKAGMARVDYCRDEIALEKEIKQFLDARNFDLQLSKSRAYCDRFYNQLGDEDKKTLLNRLSEFARQPFIKTERITPSLLSRVFASEATYLYWIGSSSVNVNALDSD